MARHLATLKNNRGQAMIESLAMSATLIAGVMILLAVMYFGYVHIGANYLLHELLVCEETLGEQHCEKDFHRKFEKFLFAARVLTLEVRRRGDKWSARVVVEMPMQRTLTIKKEF